ncbi:hypothetical protein [Synoicihabitans lomoniglobus]|uniref:Uncharacterized protein n=1 Tax=Synoicihabitans lomoniglobus TaxID=2909285 RepID=A0AAF0CRP3_9BACT|nr:hypothetical protein [Opitutaceae bacterium LMO-M01]WED66848.1 hypothetical protein PXH66_08295 [Opitutaceae bacterium LMO-M01]
MSVLRPKIAAGQTLPLRVAGRYVDIISAASLIGVKMGDMPRSDFHPGTGTGVGPGQEFAFIELTNTAAFDQFVEVWVGYDHFNDNRKAMTEPKTELVPWDDTEIPATSGVTFAPDLSVGTRRRRKLIIIDNQDPAVSLQWRVDGVVGGTVAFGEKVQLPVSEVIEIYNPTGSAVACYVSEIYWLDS